VGALIAEGLMREDDGRLAITRAGRALQDEITALRRDELVGEQVEVLVDAPGIARSHREAPEIDGIVVVPDSLEVGSFASVQVVAAMGPDVEAA
jgi:ribosomal protein S12 methylthiotransferase